MDYFIVAEGLQKELLNMVIQEIFRAYIFICCISMHDIMYVSLWRNNIPVHISKFISLELHILSIVSFQRSDSSWF